jgi:hypothetical protein
MTDDDDFKPGSVLRPAPIPVGTAAGKQPGIQVNPFRKTYPPPAPTLPVLWPNLKEKDVERSERAKAGWEKRRSRQQHHLPDRHATGDLTVAEAIELARLIDKYPVIRKVLGA